MTPRNDAAAEVEPGGMTRAEVASDFRDDVLAGLALSQKAIPSKHLYDARGAGLFDRISELDEYYPTRTELAIMQRHAPDMARLVGPRAMVVEPGSGAGIKTRLLLEALEDPVALVPIDIAREQLGQVAGALNAAYPKLEVLPLWGDFMQELELPEPSRPADCVVVYFPGSTIGNFPPDDAVTLLKNFRCMMGAATPTVPGDGVGTPTVPGGRAACRGAALVGFDLKKDPAILHAAYNDREGVTAEFNLNLLRRINRELRGNFDLDAFRHEAPWVEDAGRIEMRLVSQRDQTVTVAGRHFIFHAGEWIWTESSHKYDEDGVGDLAARAGLDLERAWTDDRHWFLVAALRPAAGAPRAPRSVPGDDA
jgi:L-histidine N-alpha-methyltransferase